MKNSSKIKLSILALTAVLGTSVLVAHQTYAADATPAESASATDVEIPDAFKEYGVSESLQAAIDSTFAQVPELTNYYEMYYAVQAINGLGVTVAIAPDGTVGRGAGTSQAHEELLDQMEAHGVNIDDPQNTTYGEVIALAMASPAYSTDPEFKAAADMAFAEYSQGVATLKRNLLIVDPTLTDLDTKTDAELLAIYNNLPAVKNHTYDDMIQDIEIAKAIVAAYADGSVDRDILAKVAAQTYQDFITAAKALNPDFQIDLSGLKKLTTTPTAPDTGETSDGEISAVIVTVAVASVAAIASVSGITVVAKRYLFSPLKRRK